MGYPPPKRPDRPTNPARPRVQSEREAEARQSHDQPNVDPTERAELAIQQISELKTAFEALKAESAEDKATIVDLKKLLNEAYDQIRELNKQAREGREADRELKEKQAADVKELKDQIKLEVKAEVKAELSERMKETANNAARSQQRTTKAWSGIIAGAASIVITVLGSYVSQRCGDPVKPNLQLKQDRNALPTPNPNNPAGMPTPRP
jgi:flagellar hook-basal body complex protein FliE